MAVVVDSSHVHIEPTSGLELVDDTVVSSLTHSDLSTTSNDDSGIISWDILPGADLVGEEFTDEFLTIPSPTLIQPSDSRATLDILFQSSAIDESYLQDVDTSSLQLELDSMPPSPLFSKEKGQSSPDEDSTEKKALKECIVCLQTVGLHSKKLVELKCCGNDICSECMKEMITVRVTDGLTYIPCPNPECAKAFTHDMIAKHIVDKDIRNKYERFRLNTEVDGTKKTCPNCCCITESDLPPFNPRKKTVLTPAEYMISCDECSFKWCFNCHSPWHEGLSCKSYREGDKQFMSWTKARKKGHVPNCQLCPKCKVYIERSSGCDHMTCNRCNSHFCYKCGGKFRDFPGLGDHYKKLSVLGCRYRYLPEQNVKRKVIRGGYLFAKCAAATGFPILLVGGVAVVIVGAVVIVPIGAGIIGALLIRKKIRGY